MNERKLEKKPLITPNPAIEDESQYSIGKILLIWFLAAVPMALLGWVIAPFLLEPLFASIFSTSGMVIGVSRISALTLGLIWQFVLSLIIVKRERGDIKFSTLKDRLWLKQPVNPSTNQPDKKQWLWLILFLVGIVIWEMMLGKYLNIGTYVDSPIINQFDMGAFLENPLVKEELVGAWWFFALNVVFLTFNTFLGEEFIFRGILLPKMKKAFGKWDWVMNGILMGAYHLHQPWMILSGIVASILFYSLPSRRYKSSWYGIITHSGQSVFFIIIFLGLTLGIA